MKIWAEKWFVLVVAVLSASFIYWLSWKETLPFGIAINAGLWVIVSVCTATVWTLLARSTIGGLALNAVQVVAFSFALSLIQWFIGSSFASSTNLSILTVIILVLSYGVFMLWLGRHQFSAFQATGGVANDDLLSVRSNSSRGVFAQLLRSKSRGLALNLIRKEVRLLWPLWIVTGLAVAFLVTVLPLQLALASNASHSFDTTPYIALFLVYGTLVALLAGSLPLGEERMSGTHSWHLTLPVSVRSLWFVKLAVGLTSSAICIGLVAGIAGALLGSAFWTALIVVFGQGFNVVLWLSAILTLAAFWCACAIKGTVRAILWVLPAFGAVVSTFGLGILTNRYLVEIGFWDFVISVLHPFPMDTWTHAFQLIFYRPTAVALLFAAPLLLLALFQTQSMFREEVNERVVALLRNLLLPITLAFVMGFAQEAPAFLMIRNTSQAQSVLAEVHNAVDKMQIDPTRLRSTSPIQLTFQDLNSISPMSMAARRWLGDATISITAQEVTYRVWRNRQWEVETFPYLTTIHLKHDWDCSVAGPDRNYYSCVSPSGRWGYVPLERLIQEHRER
jgi:hypothetical protein